MKNWNKHIIIWTLITLLLSAITISSIHQFIHHSGKSVSYIDSHDHSATITKADVECFLCDFQLQNFVEVTLPDFEPFTIEAFSTTVTTYTSDFVYQQVKNFSLRAPPYCR